MEITKNQIVDVINLMMTRLDSLENEQTKQKEYIAQIKKRMLELNDFINDITDFSKMYSSISMNPYISL